MNNKRIWLRLVFFISICFLVFACTSVQSSPTPTPFATSTPTPTPELQDNVSIIDEFFKERVDQKQFSGSVLIAQKGKILLNAGYGLADYENEIPITPQTKFYIGSITKQITASAVMILYERGEIELDQPVCIYLPDCPDHWQAITIHNLLTHTSGLDWEFLEEKNLPGITYEQAEVVNWYWDTPLAFEPGDHFSYSGGGYALLGYLIE